MSERLELLIIEDSADDADLLIREIRQGGYDPAYVRVDTAEGLTAALDRQEWKIIIADYTMPHFSGTHALSMVRARGLDTPFIFVSATIGEDVAVEAMKAGAQDYLIKGHLKRLIPAIQRELREAEIRRERTRVQAKLQQLSRAVEQSANLVAISDVHGTVEYVNPKFLETMGYDVDEIVGGRFPFGIVGAGDESANEAIWSAVLAGEDWHGELENRRKTGAPVFVAATISPIKDESGRISHFISIQEDVTRRRAAEEQLHRAQRMEAIGQLTGGLAHDFNNLLAIIVGNLDMILEEFEIAPQARRLVDSAMRAGLRGADLTRHLLAFARRQSLEAKAFQLNDLVKGMAELLRRTLGEQIEITMALAEGLAPVFADATQVESACLNLAINARDAMPNGGRLTIETAEIYLDEEYAAENIDVASGSYVLLTVSDTGTGISPDIIGKVFEPFFTTKEAGRGTGLGLSMVYGFAKQSGGQVKIYSELGHGTVVRLYLPRAKGGARPVKDETPASIENAVQPATVLVVEDNPEVRSVAVTQLAGLGYSPIEAESASAALVILNAAQPIDLLFTDIVMPGGMTGLELAKEAQKIRPGLKVLYTSGFAEASLQQNGQFASIRNLLLTKPYRRIDLGRKIREVLGGRRAKK